MGEIWLVLLTSTQGRHGGAPSSHVGTGGSLALIQLCGGRGLSVATTQPHKGWGREHGLVLQGEGVWLSPNQAVQGKGMWQWVRWHPLSNFPTHGEPYGLDAMVPWTVFGQWAGS